MAFCPMLVRFIDGGEVEVVNVVQIATMKIEVAT